MGRKTPTNLGDFYIINEKLDRKIRKFKGKLLRWYRTERKKKYLWRDFPWRREQTGDYEKLIAEILLQKTRAENIVETYNKFLMKYPTLSDLGRAHYEDLVDLLTPLGLQRNRARNLIKLAKALLELGYIPSDHKNLRKLPGIGPYIANAFLVSAHNKRLPVVDTNVRRICERVFSIVSKKDPRRDKKIWEFVELLLPAKNCREFTWAILDFSAIVCRRKNPRCDKCPIAKICDYSLSKE